MEQKETLDIDDSSHELNVIKQTTKQNIRYNREYLLSYVKENNIVLLQEYSGNINRKTTIISECLNDECENSSSKTYVQFLKSGSYCKVCTCKNSRKKMEATNMERYGVKHPSQNPGVKEKIEATNMERYGVKHPSQDPGVREKMEATNIKRYGAKHHMQNSEVSEKASHNAYKAYDYMFPSGKTIRLQGYEKFAVDDLLSQNISEDDIITKRTEVPKCEYKDSDGNVHRYYVDILIKSQKFCIEVKSIWTLEKNKDKVVFTKKALEDLGYRCEIWVYDGKGVRIQTI